MNKYPRFYERVSNNLYRLKIPGGWRVKEIIPETREVNILFQLDPNHEWKLKKIIMWSVWLIRVDHRNKINVIKALRNELKLSLLDAKNLTECTPVEVYKSDDSDEIDRIADALRREGAEVEIRQTESDDED